MNSQYFTKEQVAAGELNEFLNVLLKQCYGKGESFNDIHIKPVDCGSFVIEWVETSWSGEWGGHWQYINDDDEEVVMKYYEFPDDHYELFQTKEQYEVALKEWLEEHKDEEWEISEYGRWHSKAAQRKWEEQLAKEREKNLCETQKE